MSDSFWDKVEKCDHSNISPNYYVGFSCDTPYCSGYECHCLDCGVYISECYCGYNRGMSGWSHRRYRNFEKKQERRRKEKKQDTSVRTLAVKHNLDLSKIRVRTLDEIEFD